MKKLIFTSILIINILTVYSQQSFFYSISTVAPKNKDVTKLIITYEIAGNKYQDSLDLGKNQLKIQKKLSQPVAATISTNIAQIQPLNVILANNQLTVSIVEKSIQVGKSKLQEDFLFLTKNDRIRPTYFPLYGELSEKNDTLGLKKLGTIFEELKNDDIKKSFEYFKANKTSLLSLFSFNRYTTFFADYSKVEKDFSLLPSWAKNSPDGKNILAKIEGAKSAQVNTQAKEFTQKSSIGEIINLDDYKGKFILLDFWASWCAPCRKEHPNLIKTYEQFKDKNFEIISVSLDSEKANWLNAISKDKITWIQISDLKGQQNEIALKYGVQSVPANFLIDPNGLILAKNIKGEELNLKLKKLINK